MAVEVTEENLDVCRDALNSLRVNRDRLVEILTGEGYPVECAFPGFRTVFLKPVEVDKLIYELDARIREHLVTKIAREQEKRVEPVPLSEAQMHFDSVTFIAVLKNQFPKMATEEAQAIAARTNYLINYLTGFLDGRRSSVPQSLSNVEASAEYAALRYMIASMDKTGDKHYMGGLSDAAERAMKNEAPQPSAASPKAS